MFLATILIIIPLAVLYALGLVYLFAPRHLPYHRTVVVKLGERRLVGELSDLSTICLIGTGAVSLGAINVAPATTTAVFSMLLVMVVTIVVILRASLLDVALVARKCAGMAVITFCAVGVLLLPVATRPGVLLSSVVAVPMIAYIAHRSRRLGIESGAKAPWLILAGLCLLFILGGTLALFA